ncbi:MAG: hypothetical protein ABJA18_06040 [bacterium]
MHEIATVNRKHVNVVLAPLPFRAFSAREPGGFSPGPLAQAFTFRAFGADNLKL